MAEPRKIASTRTLSLSTLAVLAILLTNIAFIYEGLVDQQAHQLLVEHTNEVQGELEQVLSGMRDAETGTRGFVLSGKETFLEPYVTGRQGAIDHLRQLKALTLDNPGQQLRVDQATAKCQSLLEWQGILIDKARSEGLDAARTLVATGEGKERMDAIRHIVADMGRQSKDLLDKRAAAAEASRQRINLSLMVTALVSVVLVLVAFYFIRRYVVLQRIEENRLSDDVWLKGGLADLSAVLRGEQSLKAVGDKALAFFARYVNAQVGALYILRPDGLELASVFARGSGENRAPARLKLSETLAGEAARQGRVIQLDNVPESYVKVTSALGDAAPRKLVVLPVTFDGVTKGVVELGFLNDPPRQTLALLETLKEPLGISLSVAQNRSELQALLEETQRQAEELAAQQEELKASNEELESQANVLRASQDKLSVQQEELRQTNEELELQATAVETQRVTLALKNTDLLKAKADLENKAREAELSSRYKSEFLANMSHEFRTPLNSLLLLSTLLSENKEGTLTPKQIDFAKTIFKSGNDLLTLVNDILDLSKVEAGKLTLTPEQVNLGEFRVSLVRDFQHSAAEKGLAFDVVVAADAPRWIRTDNQRLEQILKNLVSNAIKFTASGKVGIQISRGPRSSVDFQVTDTGIGIPFDKQALIFEAFHQGDGSTNRTYGGTGLGLTISRELTHLLGGTLSVTSSPGTGSTFTLQLPEEMPETVGTIEPRDVDDAAVVIPAVSVVPEGPDLSKELDRDLVLKPTDRLVLIVEDDPAFGRILVDLANDAGFKAVLVANGEDCLRVARRHRVSAVLLDIKLPDMSGLSVLERLKGDAATRHVPIHVISGAESAANALSLGAIGYLLKPAKKEQLQGVFARIESILAKKVKRILLVEDDKLQRQAVKDLLGNGDVVITEAVSGAQAKELLRGEPFDCMVLDLRLPDTTGFALLEELESVAPGTTPPVVVYTAQDLSHEEQQKLERYAESIIIKGVRSPERLLDEVSLFLHRVESSLPQKSQALMQKLRLDSKGLAGRKILLADDDMRNVFALVNALEASGVKTVVARNGKEALAQLDKDGGIELVLMDIMMPEMDGYQAMTALRKDPRFKKLPVIALTAKAMKGDLEKCLTAGANDYLAKPIKLERLLSLLKVWLPHKV